jgi:hypothetical protein
MTKKELMSAIADYDDDTPVVVIMSNKTYKYPSGLQYWIQKIQYGCGWCTDGPQTIKLYIHEFNEDLQAK